MLNKLEIIEANKAASAARKGPKKEPINNTELVATFRSLGGRVMHLRPTDRRRGFTVAYVEKNNRVSFATSVQHTADTFDKKTGTKTAIEAYFEGRAVVLPKISGFRASDMFHQLSWVLG
jgi:hypothetical protein